MRPLMLFPPISAYAAVLYAAMLHVIEAAFLLRGTDADGSIGVAALLHLVPNRRWLIATLIVSAACAGVVLVRRSLPPVLAVLLLVPQQVLLLTTAIAAWLAVWYGAYADGVLRAPDFITADQLPRGMFSLLHLTAIYGLAVYHAYGLRERRS